ncbi:hypothetical protein [Mycolicibacterium sp. XJ870]
MTEQTEAKFGTEPQRELGIAYRISEDLITAAKDSPNTRYALVELMQERIKHDVLIATAPEEPNEGQPSDSK